MHYFKLIGDPDSFRELWENREALDKYLKRLKELMEEDVSLDYEQRQATGTKNVEIQAQAEDIFRKK